MKIVGIYKIPALWNRKGKKEFVHNTIDNYLLMDNIQDFKEHSHRITNIRDNVYFEMFKKMNIHNSEAHYIFIDENAETIYNTIIDNINVWILRSHEDLCSFMDADVYFLRGNYLNYYNYFTSSAKFCKIIFYPATSLKFSYKNNGKIIKPFENFIYNSTIDKECINKLNHPFYERIDIALIHEDENYMKIFEKSKKKIIFNKPPCSAFKFLDITRTYDYIFIGDATQSTKNHHLMFHFIEYCEKNQLSIKIIYISDKELLKKNVENFIDPTELNFVNLQFENYLTPEQLNIYMNKSKINLIFSGRDAFPRTISETMSAGCYNVALDTLSDGKNVISGLCGEIINISDGCINIRKSNSLSYISVSIIWSKIIEILNKSLNHSIISSEFQQNIKENEKNLLNYIHVIIMKNKWSFTENVLSDFIKNDFCNIFIKRIIRPCNSTQKSVACQYPQIKSKHVNQYFLDIFPTNNNYILKYIYIEIINPFTKNRKTKNTINFENDIVELNQDVDVFYYINTFKNKNDFIYIKTRSLNIFSIIKNIRCVLMRGYIDDNILNTIPFKNALKIFLPCESHRYIPHNIRINSLDNIDKSSIHKLFTNKILNFFDIILCDDLSLLNYYKKLYNTFYNKFKIYNKITPRMFQSANYMKETKYDLIYLSSLKSGGTKSYDAFINFVKYLKNTKSTLKVCLLNSFETPNISILKDIAYEHLTIHINANVIENIQKSKCTLLTSSRDAQPRTLSECIVNNCYVIAFNTLTNGQHLITPDTGIIIDVNTTYDDNYNCYKYASSSIADVKIFDQIVKYVNKAKRLDNNNVVKRLITPFT